jgi:hypothetical protein
VPVGHDRIVVENHEPESRAGVGRFLRAGGQIWGWLYRYDLVFVTLQRIACARAGSWSLSRAAVAFKARVRSLSHIRLCGREQLELRAADVLLGETRLSD